MNLKLLFHPKQLAALIRVKLSRASELNAAIVASKKRFGNHPAYNLDSMPLGFAPRRYNSDDDTKLLKRICAAYIKAKERQQGESETFNVSNEWLPIYERQLGPVMHALANQDLDDLRVMYQNFFRDPCSTGLAGLPVDMGKYYFSGNIKEKYRHLFLGDALHRHELWKEEIGNAYTIQDLVSPDIGNPYGFFVDGTFLKTGSDYLHYYASQIGTLLSGTANPTVLELGGGFGGMAYYLIRDSPQITYIDFDLPENLALASYYLLKAFPDVPATLFGEAELTSQLLRESRIVLMPSFEIKKLHDKSISLSFNSYSLAEMSPATVKEYMSHIARVTDGYFLHVNHTKNAVVTADGFVTDEHAFKLLERRIAGWNLGRGPNSDEFQFLYKTGQT